MPELLHVARLPRERISATQLRRMILTESYRAHVGHIGSCLSVVEILMALYSSVLRAKGPDDPERDRFVLSKGHAGLALFSVLYFKGWLSRAQLDTFCQNDTLLGVHPEVALAGVDFSTGSLGQGISFATGAALAARMMRSSRRIFCLISDAECNEGSVWEAAMFAAHHKLSNLEVIVDLNGIQAFGRTCDVMNVSNLADRWRAFNWRVSEVDGHSMLALVDVLSRRSHTSSPHLILARTVFGKGVSYMEQGIPLTQKNLPVQAMNWHYLPMSSEEFDVAIKELEHLD
jgi:transketolase